MGSIAIPSGFSSAAATKLLTTMQTVQSTNSSLIAAAEGPSFDASSKPGVSGDTMFSIIAAAAKVKSASVTRAHPASSLNGSADDTDVASASTDKDGEAIGGAQALIDDPNFQKNYSVEQAAQNYYAQLNQIAGSFRRTAGATRPGETNGQIIAGTMSLQGDSALAFARAFDNQSLTIVDASTLNIGVKVERYWIKGAGNEVIGSGANISVDQTAYEAWSTAHPRSAWTDDHGHQGGGGLMVTW